MVDCVFIHFRGDSFSKRENRTISVLTGMTKPFFEFNRKFVQSVLNMKPKLTDLTGRRRHSVPSISEQPARSVAFRYVDTPGYTKLYEP